MSSYRDARLSVRALTPVACWSWTALSRDRRQWLDGQAGPSSTTVQLWTNGVLDLPGISRATDVNTRINQWVSRQQSLWTDGAPDGSGVRSRDGHQCTHRQVGEGGLLTERQSTYGQIGLSIVQERARGTDVSTQMDKLGSSQPNDGPCVDKWGS